VYHHTTKMEQTMWQQLGMMDFNLQEMKASQEPG
jgi:hypothetical protein